MSRIRWPLSVNDGVSDHGNGHRGILGDCRILFGTHGLGDVGIDLPGILRLSPNKCWGVEAFAGSVICQFLARDNSRTALMKTKGRSSHTPKSTLSGRIRPVRTCICRLG